MKRKTVEKFIREANLIHNNKYDYSKASYYNAYTKVCIICPTHREFYQKPNDHLRGRGCPKCNGGVRISTESFIEKAKEIHGDKYSYENVIYKNSKTEVSIICPIHGEFLQCPNYHLNGHGCPVCGGSQKLTKDDFIRKSIEIHGNKYGYSKVEYINNHTKVCIECPEHGDFWQLPSEHLRGKGCQKCNERKLEKNVRLFLEQNDIDYEFQYQYDDDNRLSTLDFYLPRYNIGIECQGEQHFIPVDFAGCGNEWAERMLLENKNRDSIKNRKCMEQGIELIYYVDRQYEPYLGKDDIYNNVNVIFNLDNINDKIKNKNE